MVFWRTFSLVGLSFAFQEAGAFIATTFHAFQPRRTCQGILLQQIDDGIDSELFSDFMSRFQGDFDNYHQVVQDRQSGMEPREGGGHEHIHCTLVPLLSQENKVMAAFYFDGMPQRIFRFRVYQLFPSGDVINMKLYTLHPELEGEIRQNYTQIPEEWPRVYSNFVQEHSKELPIKELKRCDVQWSRVPDPNQHTYMNEIKDKDAIHAVMVYGEALVESTMIPDTQIRILDQLSLWHNEFWIHDRGFDPDTGDFIYGNQRGVPYQMQRVTDLNVAKQVRQVVNTDLRWTLGPEWRNEDGYVTKMKKIGGVSTRLNS